MHDVTMRGRDFGVWKVWADLATRGRSWTFAEPPGLGVWEKPPAYPQPPPLEAFFAAPNESQTRLGEYYRQRQADLQAMIARWWHDGTIRSAPMASETVIQIFWTSDGHYAEENSIDARIGHEEWKEIVVPLPTTAPVTGIRIDFYSALTRIEIAEIAVETESGERLFQAQTAAEFESIALLGDCARGAGEPFTVEVTSVDPQVQLPPFPQPASGLLVRMRLRVRQDL